MLYLNTAGKELLKAKELLSNSIGSIFEEAMKKQIIDLYSEEILEEMLSYSDIEFKEYINANYMNSLEEYIRILNENISSEYTAYAYKNDAYISYSTKTNFNFSFDNLVKLGFKDKDELVTLILKKFLIYEVTSSYLIVDDLSIKYHNSELTLIYKIDRTLGYLSNLESVCTHLLETYNYIVSKISVTPSIDYRKVLDIYLNVPANNWLLSMKEYCSLSFVPIDDPDFKKILKKKLTPTVLKLFLSKNYDELKKFLCKYAIHSANANDKKIINNLIHSYELKQKFNRIANSSNVNIDVNNNGITISKLLSYRMSHNKLYYTDFMEDEKERFVFITNVIKSKLIYNVSKRYPNNFNKDEFLNSFNTANDNISCTLSLKFDVDNPSLDYNYINKLKDFFDNVFYLSTLM